MSDLIDRQAGEAKAVRKGVLIDVRGCCLGVCRFERRGEVNEMQ